MTAQTPADTSPAAEEIQGDLYPSEEKRNPFQALTHRDFRLYWSGGFVSQLGSQMRLVAVGVQLWDLTHSYTAVGLLGLVKLIPLLGLSLFGGVVADALDRRRLMIITQSTMAITSAILAVETARGAGSALLIYAVSALSSGAVAFDNPARAALITNLVPRNHLPNALSLNIIVWQVAMVVGPLMAGLFLPMRELGFTLMYSIDAVSFGAVVIALILIRTRTQVAETRNVSVGAAVEGFRFLKRAPIILSTMSLDFFATLFGAASVLIPAFAERVLHVDRELWGILYAAPAVGAVVAGVVMSWLGNVRSQGRLVLVSVAAYGLSTILFGASTYFWLTALALAGIGASDTVSMVMRQTIRQMSTPDELRGRMTSVNMIFYMGGPQLGEFEAGFAAQVVGLGPSVMLGGLAVVALAAVVGRLVPALRNYDRA